jgi:hypothetical protein
MPKMLPRYKGSFVTGSYFAVLSFVLAETDRFQISRDWRQSGTSLQPLAVPQGAREMQDGRGWAGPYKISFGLRLPRDNNIRSWIREVTQRPVTNLPLNCVKSVPASLKLSDGGQ